MLKLEGDLERASGVTGKIQFPDVVLILRMFAFFFWLHCVSMACQILVLWPGIEPVSSAVKAWSPNHWTTKEFPRDVHLIIIHQVIVLLNWLFSICFSMNNKHDKCETTANISFKIFPPIGDYSYSGRDSLIFLVDASRAMFESQDEDELTPFDMSIQVRLPFH